MKSFSQFGIKTTCKGFEGDKIKMPKILDCEIVVHHYKIEPTKIYKDKGHGKCLQMQISIKNEKRVVFTSGTNLIESILQVPEDGFPFTTTIIEENERFKFT